MRELQNKEHFRRSIYSWPSLLILLLLTVVLAKGAVNMVIKERQSRDRISVLREEIQVMSLRENILTKKIERLDTNEGLEDEIKDKFSVVKDGESVAVIVDNKQQASTTDESEISWFRKVLNAIIGNK